MPGINSGLSRQIKTGVRSDVKFPKSYSQNHSCREWQTRLEGMMLCALYLIS